MASAVLCGYRPEDVATCLPDQTSTV